MTLKIIIADDHNVMRDGLRVLIEKQSGMEVVAEAENGRDAFKLTKKFKPDVVVMDISMPDLNGIDATQMIASDCPGTKVVVFSMHADRQFIVGALRAGACGYLLKNSAFEELALAIRTVARNQTYLSAKIANTVVKDYVEKLTITQPSAASDLTLREREILQMISEGTSAQHISNRLNISIKTVQTHRRNIMEKLDVYSVAELTKFALREGLTSLDS